MTTKNQPSGRTRSTRAAQSKETARNFATTRAKRAPARKSDVKRVPKKLATPVREVKLPTNMSQRAIEKSIVLKREFDDHYRRAMYRVAYVAGLCFILVGGTFAGGALMTDSVPRLQVAQLSNFASTTDLMERFDLDRSIDDTTQIVQAPAPTPTTVPDPTIKLIDPIPSVTDDRFTVKVQADYAKRLIVKVKVVLGGTGFMPDPAVDDRGNYEFRTNIPADTYPTGTYQLILIAEGESGKNISVPSGYFKVPSLTGSEPTGTPPEEVVIDEETGLIDTSDFQADPTANFNDPSPSVVDFTIFKSNRTLTGIETIGVNVPGEYTYIELYRRPVAGGNNQFVALASKRFDRWQFVVDSTKIPNGDYYFFAQTKGSGSTQTTPNLRMTVQNATASVSPTPTNVSPTPTYVAPSPTPIRDAIEYTQQERESLLPVRTFVLETPEEESEMERPRLTPEEERVRTIEVATERIIKSNTATLEELYKSYADARRTGDQEVIERARTNLREKRTELVEQVNDTTDEERAELARKLEEQIEDFEDRVERFEGVRRERIERIKAANVDTDGDGISDIDERTLYGTDPNVADSDGDGVPDGVELVRGLNPRGATPEDIIRFESPKETIGLVREDLIVEAVTAISVSEEDRPEVETPLRTEIRGKALPNSFVTLYIFSSPTVVTIKTDADGSFVYTFDKELEDGAHDVYVAVTDNTGEIVAQSSPFSFIKQAQAFTPVDAAESEVVSIDAIESATARGYNIAIGIGVLALGIILLMLGIGLRTKDDEIEKITVTVDGEGSDARPAPTSEKRIEHIDAT